MPLDGIYVKILDSSVPGDYPNFVNYQDYYYEKTGALGPGRIPSNTYTTLLAEISGFNTLEATVIAAANEASRPFEAPVSIYAYYDI